MQLRGWLKHQVVNVLIDKRIEEKSHEFFFCLNLELIDYFHVYYMDHQPTSCRQKMMNISPNMADYLTVRDHGWTNRQHGGNQHGTYYDVGSCILNYLLYKIFKELVINCSSRSYSF